MSTIVYHHQQQQLLGFQPRHETHHHHHQVVEPSWSLSLKLNPPKHHQQHQIESTLKPPLVSSNSNNNYHNTSSSGSGSGGWTSIQSLTPSVNYSKDEVYVHPLTKRSSSKLSDKSLEMCTENLGCETGTDIIHSSSSSSSSNSSFLFSFTALSKPSNNQDSSSSLAAAAVSSRQVMKRSHSAAKKTHSLPPPLTSMTGSTSLRVRPHRESGRLVMTAVSTSPRTSNIQAERSNGRLTMCLIMDHSQESTVFPYNGTTTTTTTTGEPTDMINESDLVMTTHETDKCHVRCKQDEGEEEEEDDDDDKTIKQLEVIHNHIGISNSKQEGEEEEDDTSGVHVVETDKQEASVDWRIVGVDQLHHQWPTRCNQNGGRGSNTTNCTTTLINWEPFWVTT